MNFAVSVRTRFDYDYGLRFRGEAVRENGWVVGFVQETSAEDDQLLENFINQLQVRGESNLIALPCETTSFEYTNTHDAIEDYSPALVAKTDVSIDSLRRIRASLIQLIRGAYFVVPGNESALLLNNNGKYAMLAGPRDLVEKTIGCNCEESWSPVRANDCIDPLLLCRLRAALLACGMS